MNHSSPARARWAAIAWLAVVLILTLTSSPESTEGASRTPWTCLVCGGSGLADVLQNVLLFIPLGFLLRSLDLRAIRVWGIAALLPLTIEMLQAWVIAGRDGSLSDVLTNGAGTMLAYFGAPVITRFRTIPPRVARNALLACVIAVLAQFVLSVYLLQPALNQPSTTWARIAPEIAGRPRFAGRVTDFQVNGVEYHDRDIPATLAGGDVAVSVSVEWLGEVHGTSTIARIDGSAGDAVVSIDQRGMAYGIEVFSRASLARLREPVIAVPAPAGIAIGDTVVITYRWISDAITVTASNGRVTSTTQGRLRPWHGWTLLNPFTGRIRFDRIFSLWTVLWLAAWGGAMGLLGWRALRPARSA